MVHKHRVCYFWIKKLVIEVNKLLLKNSLFRKLNGTIYIRFTIAKSTYQYSVTHSIVTIIEIRLMKSVVAQAHIFSSNLRIVCIVRFRDQNFLGDTVQGYYANQLKLTVFLPACNKLGHYNGLCDKHSIKQLFISDNRVTTDKSYTSRSNAAPTSY